MFAASYGALLAVAGVEAGGGGTRNTHLAIPLVGAFLRNHRTDNSVQILAGVPQVVGAGLFLLGLASTVNVRVRDWRGPGVSVSPIAGPGLAGISVGGEL
jgi:hypothetical protein